MKLAPQSRAPRLALGVFVVLSGGLFWVGREAASWRPEWIGQGLEGTSLTISPDGSLLATDDKLLDLRSGKVLKDFGQGMDTSDNFFSADGRRFAHARTVYSLPDVKIVSSIVPRNEDYVFSNRDLKAYWSFQKSSGKSVLKRLNLANQQERFLPLPPPCEHWNWQLSPDETLVALNIDTREDKHAEVYRVENSHLVRVRAFPPSEDFICRMTFSPDNSLFADTDAEGIGTRVFELSTGRQLCQLPFFNGSAEFVFSPDSRSIVAVDRLDGLVKVYDARTGRVVRVLPSLKKSSDDGFSHLAWSPDSRFVFVSKGSGNIWRIRVK